jgi:hypothetical protein
MGEDDVSIAVQAQIDLRNELQAEIEKFYQDHPPVGPSRSVLQFYRDCLSKAIGDLAAVQGDVEHYEQTLIPTLEQNLELFQRRRLKVQERLSELAEASEVTLDGIENPDAIISSTIQNLETEITNCDAKILTAKSRIQAVRGESRRMDDLARAEKRSTANALWAEEVKLERLVRAGDELAARSLKLDRLTIDPFFRAAIPRRHSTFEVAPALKTP